MKINVNHKNIEKFFVTVGIGGMITLETISAGPFINPRTHLVDFYYVNTKNINLSNEEFVQKFDEIYSESPKLQEQWKDIYPELQEFLRQYADVLDQEEILDTLKNLKFKVGKRDEGTLLAVTNYMTNSITYNERLFVKKPEQIKELKLHEAFHFLFQQNFYGSFLNFFDIGKQLDEGTADILTKESKAYANVTVYGKNSNYVKALCEIIGGENYIDAAGSHDWFKLIDYISEYCSVGEALKLLRSIDKACLYYKDKGTKYDEKAWTVINKMYEKKNGVSIENSNDEIMKVYSNTLLGTRYDITGARSYNHAQVNKNYFLDLEQKHKIVFERLGKKYGEITLNEDNSFASGEVLKNEFFNDDGQIVDKDGNLTEDEYVDFDSYAK